MNVQWYSTCFMCHAPLDFAVIMGEDKMKALCTYAEFKPISFLGNTTHKKIIGLNQKKLCMRCFICKKYKEVPGPLALRNREQSGRMVLQCEYPPLSEKEIRMWFEGFDEFSKRPDLEEYMLNRSSPNIKGLIMISWLHSLQYLQEVLFR